MNQRAGATRNPGTILLAEDSAVYRRLTGDLQVFVLHQYSLRASNQPPRSESNT